jgi:hypothetical protein
MAGERVAPPRFTRRSPAPWTAERIAQELVPVRDQLVQRLPREIAAARDLTLDQRELVIDDAIDFMVTEYAKPVTVSDELERAFWAAASFRVKRAIEGRGATVRGGFRRASIDDLDRIPGADDPEAIVVRRDEQLTLLEFAATLTPREREVFACKYGSGPKVIGRKLLARWLNLPIGEVRSTERQIALKLERFVAILAAGSLCSYRSAAIRSLAAATASEAEAAAARLHLKHCSACRTVYAEHRHALHTGELQREIAGLLPLPVFDRLAEDRPLRGFFLDWMTRPFSGERTAVAAQAASSGAGRGVGTVAAVKLASICLGGAALTGGAAICVQQLAPPPTKPSQRAPRSDAKRTDDPTIPIAEVSSREPKRVATPTPTPASGSTKDRNPAAPDRHESDTPISPAPSDAQTAGADEFGPSSASAPSTPASAPATGAPEFP